MYLHLKQSGELLTTNSSQPWTSDAVYTSAQHIKEVHDSAAELGIEGLLVVSGAGNILRGEKMRAVFTGGNMAVISDTVGRIATIQNSILLSAALKDLNVPHAIFIAPNMAFLDGTLGELAPYSVEAVHQAYADGKVVLIAGGGGKDNQTTDAAVVDFMVDHANRYPDTKNIAHKTTHFDGVYDQDPREVSTAKHYRKLSAQYMLQDYERLGAVDKRCLEILRDAPEAVQMLVYSASKYTPAEAMRAWNTDQLPGTMLVPGDAAPEFDN